MTRRSRTTPQAPRRARGAALLAALSLAALLLGDAATSRAEPVDWPSWRGDAANSGARSLPLPPGAPALAPWRFEAGSHVWGYQPGLAVWSSAALGVVGGRPVLVVGSYDNNVYCLDALTGEKRWRFTTGGGVYATPALWRGRRAPADSLRRGGAAPADSLRQGGAAGGERALVFAASSDRLVYALDADLGRREWVFAIKAWRPTMGGARLAGPTVGRARGQDAVFVAHWVWDKSLAGHLQAGGVTALAAATGQHLWTAALGDNQLSAPAFGVVDGRGWLFVASENGNLYALDADDGRTLWSRTERNAIKAAPALYVAAGELRLVIGSKSGVVRCLEARRGEERWRFKTGNWVDGSAAVATVGGRPLVLVGSYDTNLYALDGERGALRWSYRTAAGIYSSPAVVREGGRQHVLISSWDHHLHCVDAASGAPLWKRFTGRPLWDSITLGDSVWASPTVADFAGQAVVYVGSYAGPLHATPLAEAARAALARPGSNRAFWVRLPLVTLATALLTLGLTWWHRRRVRAGG